MKVRFYSEKVGSENGKLVMIKTAHTSKVYGETYFRFPSGMRKMYKVWNNTVNKMIWEKAELCEII